MTLKLNGTNSVAAPAYAGDDADTGLQCGTNELKLVTGGTERVKVNSSGNVGINTTTPFSDAQLTVGNGGSGNASIAWRRTGAGENDWAFSNQGGELKVLGGGDATTIGGLSELVRFQSAGGISFNGDTAAANALDDYEEGTFTGRFNNADDNATVSHGNQTGYYVKVGSLVHFSLYFDDIDVTSTGSTTAARIYGLPFTSLSSNQHYSVVNIIHNTILTSAAGAYVNTNQTHMIPTDVGSTTTSTFSTGTNKRLMIGGTYRAA